MERLLDELYNNSQFESIIAKSEGKTDYVYRYYRMKSLWRLGQLDEASQVGQQFLFDDQLPSRWRIKFLNATGIIVAMKGEFDRSLEIFNEALAIETDDLAEQSSTLGNMGNVYRRKGELKQAYDYLQRSLSLDRQLDNPRDIARSLGNLGNVLANMGDFDEALKHYHENLDIFRELNDSVAISIGLNNIGSIYLLKGDTQQALNYQLENLKLKTSIGNPQEIAYALANIGHIYYELGQYDDTLRYYQQALDARRRVNNTLEVVSSLNDLILLHTDRHEREQAFYYLEELKQQDQEVKTIKLTTLFAEAYILKSFSRVRPKAKAMDLLEESLDLNDFYFEHRIRSLFLLSDLLLFEYNATEDPVVYEELEHRLDELYSIAKDQVMPTTIIEVLIFRSQLELIAGHFDQTEGLLLQAEEFARDNNIDHYLRLIQLEKRQLDKQIEDMKEQIKNSTLAERLDRAKLDRYIENSRIAVKELIK